MKNQTNTQSSIHLTALTNSGSKSKALIKSCARTTRNSQSITHIITKDEINKLNTKRLEAIFTKKNRRIVELARSKIIFRIEDCAPLQILRNEKHCHFIRILTEDVLFPWAYYCDPNDVFPDISLNCVFEEEIKNTLTKELKDKIIKNYMSLQIRAVEKLSTLNPCARSFNPEAIRSRLSL